MKVHKIDDVRFSLDRNGETQSLDREGELHLSVNGVILREGESLFEIPFSSLRSVIIARKKPLRLQLSSDLFVMELEGSRAERMWALRALILPLINGGDMPIPGIKTLLVLKCTGVSNPVLLGRIMGLDGTGLSQLIKDAQSQLLIDDAGSVTEKGMRLFSEQEVHFIECLEVVA